MEVPLYNRRRHELCNMSHHSSLIMWAALCAILFLGCSGETTNKTKNEPEPKTPQLSGTEQLQQQVRQCKSTTVARLNEEIPQTRSKLRSQFHETAVQLQNINDDKKKKILNDELREIASMSLALDEQEKNGKDLLFRIETTERKLERMISAKEPDPPKDDNIRKEVEEYGKLNSDSLNEMMKANVSSGTIKNLKIESRLDELHKSTNTTPVP